MRRLLPAPWTADDEAIAFRRGRGYWATTLRASALQADIRDATLLWEQSRIFPGAAVITVGLAETSVTHVIVGRVQRAVFETIRRQWGD